MRTMVVCSSNGIDIARVVADSVRAQSNRQLRALLPCRTSIVSDAVAPSGIFSQLCIATTAGPMPGGRHWEFGHTLGHHDRAVIILTADDLATKGAGLIALYVAAAHLGETRCTAIVPQGDVGTFRNDLPQVEILEYRSIVDGPSTSRTVCESVTLDARRSLAATLKGTGRAHAMPFQDLVPELLGNPGGPCEVFHSVPLLQYCAYAKEMASKSQRLVTVLSIEPKHLIDDIECDPQIIENLDEAAFLRAADARGSHYSEFRKKAGACRIVIWEDQGWLVRNRKALTPLGWLNGEMDCFCVKRSAMIQSGHRILSLEHTVFDDRVCIYDLAAQTLLIMHLDGALTSEAFGYSRLKESTLDGDLFVRYADFVKGYAVTKRPPYSESR